MQEIQSSRKHCRQVENFKGLIYTVCCAEINLFEDQGMKSKFILILKAFEELGASKLWINACMKTMFLK